MFLQKNPYIYLKSTRDQMADMDESTVHTHDHCSSRSSQTLAPLHQPPPATATQTRSSRPTPPPLASGLAVGACFYQVCALLELPPTILQTPPPYNPSAVSAPPPVPPGTPPSAVMGDRGGRVVTNPTPLGPIRNNCAHSAQNRGYRPA
jgi:hypothetical protein